MSSVTGPQTTRRRVYEILNSESKTDLAARAVNLLLIVLIALNVVAVMLETEASLHARYAEAFQAFDLFSVIVFSVEYVLRVWSCVEDPRYKGTHRPRLRYMTTPMALIDLLAIAPFYLAFVIPMDLRVLRALRLLRVFKLTRYSASMSMLLDVLQEEASVLFAGFFLLMILLILAASGAYLAEHQAQPEAFGSIPQAMWWAVVTLTTVGYGDVTPITTAGRIFGGFVTVVGVGMAALPAGVLASGVADHAHRRRDDLRRRYREALADGVVDAQEEEDLEKLRAELGLSQENARRIREEMMRSHNSKSHEEAHDHQPGICPRCGFVLDHDAAHRK